MVVGRNTSLPTNGSNKLSYVPPNAFLDSVPSPCNPKL